MKMIAKFAAVANGAESAVFISRGRGDHQSLRARGFLGDDIDNAVDRVGAPQ